MPPKPQQYLLAAPVSHENVRQYAKNMSETAILLYLALYEARGKAGRTQKQMEDDTMMSPRTIGTAVRGLAAAGTIRSLT